jgi:hypothetical protein
MMKLKKNQQKYQGQNWNLKKQGSKWKTKHTRNCNWRTKLKRIRIFINEKRTK